MLLSILLFTAALGAFAFVIGISVFLWNDDLKVAAVIVGFVLIPLGIVGLICAYVELFTDHPVIVLDERYWECGASHRETTTTYVMSGKVAVPVTSTRNVCDIYRRKP